MTLSRLQERLERAPHVFWILCVLAALIVFFSPVLFGGRVFMSDNYLPAFFLPPMFWTDALYGGYPFFADLAFGPSYPFRLLFSALGGVLGKAAAFNAFVWMGFAIGAVGTYGYVYEITGSRSGSAIGGLIFGLSGFMQGHVGHETMTHSAVWLPAVIWATHRVMIREGNAQVAALSVLVGITYLGNHPEILLQIGVVSVAYAAYVGFGEEKRVSRGGKLAAAWLLGIAMVAWHLVPALEYASFSYRTGNVRMLSLEGALPLSNLAQFALPWALGTPFPTAMAPSRYFGYMFSETVCYVPSVVIACAVAGTLARWASRPVRFWAVAAPLFLITALGPQTLLGELRFFTPGFNLFRIPARDLLTMHFAFAVLAGVGSSALVAREVQGRRLAIAIVSGIVPFALAVFFMPVVEEKAREAGIELTTLGRNPAFLIPAFLALIACISTYFATRTRESLATLLLGACVFLAAGYFGWNAPWRTASGPARDFFEKPQEARALEALSAGAPGRILVGDGWLGPHGISPNSSMMFGFANVAGYGPLLSNDYARLTGLTSGGWIRPESLSDPNLSLDLLGVRWVVPYAQDVGKWQASLAESGEPLFGRSVGGACGEGPVEDSITYVLPAPTKVARVDLVTHLGCATEVPDGTAVASLALVGAPGRVVSQRPLSAGRETAEWTAGCKGVDPPVRHPPANIFDSQALPSLPGCQGHNYLASMRFPDSPEAQSLSIAWGAARSRFPRASLRVQHVRVFDAANREIALARPAKDGAAARWKVNPIKPGFVILENRRALPRAWLVSRSVAVKGVNDEIQAVQTGVLPGGGAFVPSEVAIHSEGRTIAGNGTRSASTSVSLEGWGTRHVSAQATAQAESLLVISQRHYPGWSATIDGRPAPVRRVDGVLMAVELPPGAHRVELTFAPRGFLWWCAIAAVAALIVLGFALAGRWRRAR